MEMSYGWMIPVGIVAALIPLAAFFFFHRKARTYTDGIKVANADLLLEDPYVKRKMIRYRILQTVLLLAAMAGILMSFVILAQPYRVKMTKEESYSRDIMICLDISSSVDDLNAKLVKELQETVRHLSGERVGIVVFNTSPVLLSPLTDDYEYTIEQLENIEKALKAMKGSFHTGELDNWLYWNSYLYSGTLVGNEERGSSLIGDGLLGAVFNFPNADKKRTRVVIFSTDNDPQGEGFVSLTEAAQICKKKGIVVYGIGTELMYADDEAEMKEAMELTGGKFYLEESGSAFHEIVEEIESMSANLVKGKTIIRRAEDPEKWYKYLVVSFLVLLLAGLFLRRMNVWWFVRQTAVGILLAVLFVQVIEPARWTAVGTGTKMKTSSNLEVLFVVDGTISMVAQDYDGNRPRLEGVKEDCKTIIESLQGAKFSVISFDNDAQVLSPFSNNSDHAVNVIDAIAPMSELYARGSSLNTPRELMLQTLQMVKQGNEDHKVAVFFISDGEITDDSSLESYGELAPYIDGGAVLGYGTKKGGIMELKYEWEEESYILQDMSDYPWVDAVSKIDERNLKKIAGDLQISYVNRNEKESLQNILATLQKEIKVEAPDQNTDQEGLVEINNPENPWYWMFLVVAGLLVLDAVLFVRKK